VRVAIFGIKALPARGGADRVVEHLLEHLPPEHACTVYLLRDEGPTLSCTANRRYVYVPALRGKHTRPFSYFLLCSLHFLLKGKADVAHVHNADFGLFCPVLKLKRGVRLIGTFHGDPYVREKWGRLAKAFLKVSERFFVRACDVLTSVSPLKTVRGRTVHYIPNGIEPCSPTAAGGFPGLSKGSYVLFACGRLDRTKGLHHLLAAYRELPEAGPLLAIGDFSHDEAYSKSIVEEAARDSRVVLHESLLPRETLFGVIQASSVFVFPSEWEAMSMMLLEAIACKKVVVCSDIPENSAVVGNDYPFLFRSGDVASLRTTLSGVLEDVPRADRIVLPRFEELATRFSWDRAAADYDRLYKSESQSVSAASGAKLDAVEIPPTRR
jgi:glycosyltransferase involved in cell wall biosynthesis